MIRLSCDCGRALRVGESWAGQTIRCPDCDGLLEIPHPGPDQPDRSNRHCPECDGRSTRRITTRRGLRKKLRGGDPLAGDSEELNQAFVFRLPRECLRCGAIWIPPLPGWAGLLLILGGTLLLLFFLGLPIYLRFFAPHPGPVEVIYVSGGLVVGAIFVIGYGCRVVAGGAARARILRGGAREAD